MSLPTPSVHALQFLILRPCSRFRPLGKHGLFCAITWFGDSYSLICVLPSSHGPFFPKLLDKATFLNCDNPCLFGRRYQEGEQVFLSYGCLTNLELLGLSLLPALPKISSRVLVLLAQIENPFSTTLSAPTFVGSERAISLCVLNAVPKAKS